MSGTLETLWSSSLAGSLMGLNLVLNTEQSAYMKNGWTSTAGARVTIHHTEVRPLVSEFGLDVEPNKATNFAIEKVRYQHSDPTLWTLSPCQTVYSRQPAPWDTECFRAWTDTNYSGYTEGINWPYTFMVISLLIYQCDEYSRLNPFKASSKRCLENVLECFLYYWYYFSNVRDSVCLTLSYKTATVSTLSTWTGTATDRGRPPATWASPRWLSAWRTSRLSSARTCGGVAVTPPVRRSTTTPSPHPLSGHPSTTRLDLFHSHLWEYLFIVEEMDLSSYSATWKLR